MIEPIEIKVQAVPTDPGSHHGTTSAEVIGADNLTLVNKINELIEEVNKLRTMVVGVPLK